jgi:hypothetical protein
MSLPAVGWRSLRWPKGSPSECHEGSWAAEPLSCGCGTTDLAPRHLLRHVASCETLKSLIPTPVNTTRTDGPDLIHDNGIHLHFLVNGSPTDVMSAYKTALQGMSWSVTVQSSGGGGGGGGVFSGGGYGGVTDVNACAWPSQPANPDCGHGNPDLTTKTSGSMQASRGSMRDRPNGASAAARSAGGRGARPSGLIMRSD